MKSDVPLLAVNVQRPPQRFAGNVSRIFSECVLSPATRTVTVIVGEALASESVASAPTSCRMRNVWTSRVEPSPVTARAISIIETGIKSLESASIKSTAPFSRNVIMKKPSSPVTSTPPKSLTSESVLSCVSISDAVELNRNMASLSP